MELTINYNPTSEERHEIDFVLVTDNGTVKYYKVTGVSCKLNLRIVEVNGATIDYNNAMAAPPGSLTFPPKVPQSTATKSIWVENLTPIALPFHWRNEHEKYINHASDIFAFEPSIGIFEANSRIKFDIAFTPLLCNEYLERCQLVIEGIPRGSVPDPSLLPPLRRKKRVKAKKRSSGESTRNLVENSIENR